MSQAFSVYTSTLSSVWDFLAWKPYIWSWHLLAREPGGLQQADSAHGFFPCLQDLASHRICALLRQPQFQIGVASWLGKEKMGKKRRHWVFPFSLLFLRELHLACLRHNPSCWVHNLPICVNLQVKKKGPSPAAAGSPDSWGGTFHLDVHSVWGYG